MGKTSDKQIKDIKDTKEALRGSIKQAKHLVDKAQLPLQKHKKTFDRQPD